MTRTDASAPAPRSRRVAASPSRGALRLAHPRHETVLDGPRGELHLDAGHAAPAQVLAQHARHRASPAVLERGELVINRRDEIVLLLDGRAEHGGEESQILLHRKIRVEGEASRHVADAATQIPHVARDIASEHRDAALIGEY